MLVISILIILFIYLRLAQCVLRVKDTIRLIYKGTSKKTKTQVRVKNIFVITTYDFENERKKCSGVLKI